MIGMLTLIAALVGVWVGGRGIGLVIHGLAHADEDSSSLEVIRGIRGLAVAVGTVALAGGVLLEQTWLVAFGTIFLLEELYETGVVALVLRAAHGPDLASRASSASAKRSAEPRARANPRPGSLTSTSMSTKRFSRMIPSIRA